MWFTVVVEIFRQAREFPARPDVPGMLNNLWFPYDLGRARAVFFEQLGCETNCFSYVFGKVDVEIITKLLVLEGFRHARAADARMLPLWYYLAGILTNQVS